MNRTQQPEASSPIPGKGRRRLLWQFIYIFGTLLLILLLGGNDRQLASLFSGRLPLDGRWLVLCALAMVLFWLLQACAFAGIERVVDARTSFWVSLRITLFGEYYSAITPFATGGQPMQVGYYKRYGVSPAKASSILAVRYIGYLSTICALYLCALAANGRRVLAEYPLVFWLTALGFLLNFLSIVMVALLLSRASLVRSAGERIVRGLTRLRFLQSRREPWLQALDKGVREFSVAAACILRNPLRCLGAFVLLLGGVLCEFSVAYLVYRGIGLHEASYFELLAMQVFLYLAVSFAPTPGAAGATEGGFYLFFAMVFPQPLLYSAMLLWRLFTYYMQLLVGGLLVVTDELLNLRRSRKPLPGEPAPQEPEPGLPPDGVFSPAEVSPAPAIEAAHPPSDAPEPPTTAA